MQFSDCSFSRPHSGLHRRPWRRCVTGLWVIGFLQANAWSLYGAPFPDVRSFSLANGVRCGVLANADCPTVAVDVGWGAGALDEPPGCGGIRHFLTRAIAFQAVRGASAQLVVEAGARVYTQVSPDAVHVGVVMPASGLEQGVQALASVLRSQLLTASVDSQRSRILTEIDAEATSPEGATRALFLKQVFGNCGYGRSTLGTAETVGALDADTLNAFWRRCFTAGATGIGVAGGVTTAAAKAVLSRWMHEVPSGGAGGRKREVVLGAPQAGRFVTRVPDANLEWVMVGSRVPGTESSSYATASLITAVLGAGMDSRLFRRLRDEEGIAYSVAGLCPAQRHGSYVAALVAVFPEDGERAAAVIEEEMERLAAKPVPLWELERARRYILMADSLEWARPVTAAQRISESIANGDSIGFAARWRQELDMVTPQQVLEFARKWLGTRIVVRAVAEGS